MILSVQNICKTYLDYESNFKRFASWFSKNKEEKNVKTVLKDVSFDVGAGQEHPFKNHIAHTKALKRPRNEQC